MADSERAKRPQAIRHEGGEIPHPVNIAVLISNAGSGTNLQAIIDAREAGQLPLINIGLVLSDAMDAKGLDRAARHSIPYDVMPFQKGEDRNFFSASVANNLNREGIGLAVMAGWSRILTQDYFDLFEGKTINIHPGQLPNPDGAPFVFPDGTEAPWNKGLMTGRAVSHFLGLRYAGSTVHVATLDADSGPVIERTLVEVLPDDTVETLYDRMKKEEWKALVRALKNPQRIFEIAKQRAVQLHTHG